MVWLLAASKFVQWGRIFELAPPPPRRMFPRGRSCIYGTYCYDNNQVDTFVVDVFFGTILMVPSGVSEGVVVGCRAFAWDL